MNGFRLSHLLKKKNPYHVSLRSEPNRRMLPMSEGGEFYHLFRKCKFIWKI